MIARPSLFWAGVIAIVVTAAMAYRYVAGGGSGDRPPPLSAAADTLHVGPVKPSSEYKHVLRIRNTTSKPIDVEELVSSCTCAAVSPAQLTIPAHGEAKVTLTLDLVRYIKPGREPTIRGELHVAPVVAGKRQKSWAIGIEIIRPTILVFPAGDIDFGAVYQHQSVVPSEHLLFIADEIPADSVSVRASSPAIAKVTMEPVEGYDQCYRAYKLGLVLREEDRPAGLERFAIAISAAGGKNIEVPGQLNYDVGLRVHADDLPPIILRKEEEVRWSLRVYRLDTDLSAIDVTLESESPGLTCAATKEQLADGTWRVHCRMRAQAAGNHGCKCRVVAVLESGERIAAEQIFRFYVPRSAKSL